MSTYGSDSEYAERSIIHIGGILERIPITQFSAVRVRAVPRVFSSAKPECFIPQLVGLGPYHHFDRMKDELKLGVAKRVLFQHNSRVRFISEVRDFDFTLIESNYEVNSSGYYEASEFVYMVIVDGLFLLALLHHATSREDSPFSNYVLTGERLGMTLVNTGKGELTMDGVVSDIFMLENQIPTLALQHIIEVNFNNDFPIQREYLGSVMLNFCRVYSPLEFSPELHPLPETNHHLLHLMYHLIAPDPHPQPEPEPEAYRFLFYGTLGVTYTSILLWLLIWAFVYPVVLTLQPFLLIISSLLVKVIPLAGIITGPQEISIPTAPYFLSSVLDWSFYSAFATKFSFPIIRLIDRLIPISRIIGEAVETTRRWLNPKDKKKSLEARIPSVTQLRHCKIRFKPAKGDIYSIQFKEIKRELHLPPMKLGATSEVIMRNLAAYESLIKNGNESMNFSSYIEFVRGLIQTAEDVKILADENIIQTELSADEIAHIFEVPIGRSTGRPTEQIQTLQDQLKKVKPRFDAIKNIDLIFNAFLRICVIAGVVVIFSPLLAQTFQDIGCSTIFGNTSQGCKRHQVDDHAGGDYSRSSM